MKYMLMMHVPGGEPYQIAGWPAADITAHIAYMRNFVRKLSDAGELVWAEGLSGPEQAKLVRASADREPIIDGVFPESKEFLAGYWIVDVDTPVRAYAIAAEASAAPGPGGKPLNLAIEVRQVMSGPPSDWEKGA
ncbi:MAG TPA: YciI family protein [Vicinamibacterales bacterium]|nr:YciI family protein [Vicinamibacterales bacterium]